MAETDKRAAARAFVRSCNVLLKQAALYGLKHSRCATQLESTWNDLRKALADGSFAIAVAGEKLLVNGNPLACGTAEKSMASLFAAAGIGRLDFHPAVCPDEFAAVIHAFSTVKPADVLSKLKPELGKTIGNIRIHEFRVMDMVGDDAEEGRAGSGSGGYGDTVSSGLDLGVLLSDPHKLLQLIGVVSTGSAGGASGTAPGPEGVTFQEGDVLGAIRWLTNFAGAGADTPADALGAVLSAGSIGGAYTGTPGTGSAGTAGAVASQGGPGAGVSAASETGAPGSGSSGGTAGSRGSGGSPVAGMPAGGGGLAGAAAAGATVAVSGGTYASAPGEEASASQPGDEPASDLQRALQKILPPKPAREMRGALLLQLAEQVALRAVHETYQREGLNITAIQQMLDRMNQEIESLRKVLHAREQQLGRAGVPLESNEELLDLQFWKGVPDSAKRKVLLSGDAWVLPPRIIRSFVQPLLAARADIEMAAGILRNYCRFLEGTDEDARRKTASGVGQLADLYTRVGYLTTAIQCVGEQLAREPAGKLAPLLKESFALLAEEAVAARNYSAVDEWLYLLDDIEKRDATLSREIRARVPIEKRVPEMVSLAIQEPQPPEALVEVLKRVPNPTARYVIEQFALCKKREEGLRLAGVLTVLGPVSLDTVREMLLDGSPSDAISALGILSLLDPDFLHQQLPPLLRKWNRAQQDAALRQIAAAGADDRGSLLLQIIDGLDPYVIPLAIDEIGMAGNTSPDRLIQLAHGDGLAHEVPYLQVKAIEALGRMRIRSAAPVLTQLLTARSLLSWQQPREIRIVAAQALQHIEPGAARKILPGCGLNDRELIVGPASDVNPLWIRQRKYPRVNTEGLVASLLAPGGASNVKIHSISLGGGLGSTVRDPQGITDTELDLFIGLRKLTTRVIVRRARPHEVCFEFVDISLEDRSRLRGFVAEKTRTTHPAKVGS